jgi:tRNA (guanine6-N2)-methyltransferase
MVARAETSLHAEVLLRSLPGAVGFLRDDLASVPSVSVGRAGADYLLARVDGPLGRLVDLQTYSSLGVVLGAQGRDDLAVVLPSRLRDVGDQLAAMAENPDALRFRVGASVPDRPGVIAAISQELGWSNSPSQWDLNIEVHDGHVVAQVGSLFLTARLGALARVPASTTPIIAEILVRLAKVRPGDVVLDCFCGAGTNLLTVARHDVADTTLIGFDIDRQALRMAADNLARRDVHALLGRADAAQLPVADLSVDRIVANLPFGKRVGSHHENETLYPAFLREAERVLTARGRLVLLTEDKALLRETVQRTWRVKVIREVLLRSGGGTPTAYVVERSQRPRRRS